MQLRLPWTAESRGLARTFSPNNVGAISSYALKTLEIWGIPIDQAASTRLPKYVRNDDFVEYDRVIAVSKAEHYPMVETDFPEMLDRVDFFEIGDLHIEPAETAMPRLREELNVILHELAAVRD